jgi:hypothetical protein
MLISHWEKPAKEQFSYCPSGNKKLVSILVSIAKVEEKLTLTT